MNTHTLRSLLNCLLGLTSIIALIGIAQAPVAVRFAFAEVQAPEQSVLEQTLIARTASCNTVNKNLAFESTGDAVTSLQTFLVAQKYLKVRPTGYFGALTLNAVKNFQKDNGIFTTGFVGPLTRNVIKGLTCGTNLGFIGPRFMTASLNGATSTATSTFAATASTSSIVLGGGGGGYTASVVNAITGGSDASTTPDVNDPSVKILSALEAWIRSNPRTFINPPVGNDTDMDLNSDKRIDLADEMIIRGIQGKPDDVFVGVYAKIMHAMALRDGMTAAHAQFVADLDVNKDGVIDALDYVAVSKALIGARSFTIPSIISPLTNKAVISTNSGTAPSQNIAVNVPEQMLGGFEINNSTTEALAFSKISINVNVSAGAGTKNDITNIALYDAAGTIVAGPVNILHDGSANDGKIVFTDAVIARPLAISTYTAKGTLGTSINDNQTITLSFAGVEWPTGAQTHMIYSISGIADTAMNTMTAKTAHLSVSSRVAGGYKAEAGNSGVMVASLMLDASDSGENLRVAGIPAWSYYYSGMNGDELSVCQIYSGSTLLIADANVINPNAGSNGSAYAFTFDTPLIIQKGAKVFVDLHCDISPLMAESASLHWDMTGIDVAALPVVALGSGTTVTAQGQALGPTVTVNNPLMRAAAPAAAPIVTVEATPAATTTPVTE